jgi:hypothetical protein
MGEVQVEPSIYKKSTRLKEKNKQTNKQKTENPQEEKGMATVNHAYISYDCRVKQEPTRKYETVIQEATTFSKQTDRQTHTHTHTHTHRTRKGISTAKMYLTFKLLSTSYASSCGNDSTIFTISSRTWPGGTGGP